MTLLIDRTSGTAAWAQIASHLSEQIRSGVLEPGARLGTEQQLSREIGVNRHTVRRAFSALEEAGLIRSQQGRGTFVREHVLDYALGPRTRFSESLAGSRSEPVSGRGRRFLETMTLEASDAAAELLAVRRGTRLTAVRLLGLVEDRPVSLATHMFVARRFPKIAEEIEKTLSVTKALSNAGVPDYRRKMTRITAAPPDAEEAALLEVPRSRPVLRTESVNVSPEGKPVEYGLATFAADRVQLVVDG